MGMRVLRAAAWLVAMAAGGALLALAPGRTEEKAPPPTGDEIMNKVRANEFSDSTEAVIQMLMVDKAGNKQARRFRIQRLQENVLIRFLEPADIKDTGYLIMKDKEGKSRIYYYFPPPTDDYREISLDDKEGGGVAFLGSDFDITDFQIQNPEEAANTYLRTETISNIECHVVESVPKDQNYKYSKIITWVRSDYWLPVKAEFYDRAGKLVKEMKVYSYKSVSTKEGDKKIVSKSEMRDKSTDHHTILEIQSIQFDISFPNDTFTIRCLTDPACGVK
jgi:outer membrane lipoprotein-sorting protein